MRELLHARKTRVLHEDGRIESSPRVLVVSPANHLHKFGPVHESDGSAVHANESLPLLVNERQEIGLLLAFISRSPPVKKSTASKSFKFCALYSSFFFVSTSVSVRRVVSHSPVSRPSRSMVAMAWDTESCRYPFSSPMTRRCFFRGGPDWAVENAESTARMIRARGAIFIL